MRTTVAAPGHPTMPLIFEKPQRAVTSEIDHGHQQLFPFALLIGHPKWVHDAMCGPMILDETGRSSQKSVIGLLRNWHLTT
jgi:hypothetical protein